MSTAHTYKTAKGSSLKVKVCGMKHNTDAVAGLGPDYLGFIFWEGSSRFVGTPQRLFEQTEKLANESHPKLVGVFVDAEIEYILGIMNRYALDMVQLHGAETPEYCKAIKEISAQNYASKGMANPGIDIIKAFAVDGEFNFDLLAPFQEYCDYFLFDSRGPLPGGNGTRFNWEILEEYSLGKPFLLSGGLNPESLNDLKAFMDSPAAEHCIALDVNSGFELCPGEKNISALRTFLHEIRKTNKPLT